MRTYGAGLALRHGVEESDFPRCPRPHPPSIRIAAVDKPHAAGACASKGNAGGNALGSKPYS
jgi:hypothetical protein